MNRWDIINHFIEKNNYKSYLEIGYFKGWSFDQVKCDFKVAVDPNPSKTEFQQGIPYGGHLKTNEADQIYKMTSDDFFEYIKGNLISRLPEQFDIIFIDGLHEAKQVERDVHNALNHLSPRGIIVMHDCNPPLYEHTTTGIDGCWTGDTYKAFAQFRYQNPDYTTYVIDTDWGCGIIQETHTKVNWSEKPYDFTDAMINWEVFDKNRKDLLNLISVEEFKTKESERITNTDN